MNPPIWSHQKKAIELAPDKFGLFFDPGTGKSRTVLEIYRAKRDHNGRVLIFAPLNVCRNWPKEIGKFLRAKHEIFLVAGQTKPKKLRELERFNNSTAKAHKILICNIESLRSAPYLKLMQNSRAQTLIVDESHMCKSPTSKQTKGLLQLEKYLKPKHCYLLSGTPSPQGEADLWSSLFLLGQTTDGFYLWRKKYFEDKNASWADNPKHFPNYVLRQSTKNKLYAQLKRCSLSAKKEDVLDLPPLLHVTLSAELSPEQKKHYKTMEEYLFAIDDSGNELNATNVLSRTLRLQQIVAGILGDAYIQETPRMQVLGDAIELTNGAQFIVWTIFTPTYSRISRLLEKAGVSHGFLTGSTPAAEREQNMEDFQSGKLRALIAHPKAGGIGVNLTAASYSIYYTKSYSLVDDMQSEARNHRGGSERHKSITRIDIVAPETIDETITESLREKKTIQEFILALKGGSG